MPACTSVHITRPASKVTLNDGSKVAAPEGIDLMGGSKAEIRLDKFFGILLARRSHPRSLWMLEGSLEDSHNGDVDGINLSL